MRTGAARVGRGARPTARWGRLVPSADNLKLAYFITAHHKPYQLRWLLDAIYAEDCHYLLHVDLKSRMLVKENRRGVYAEVKRILADFPRVRLLPSRIVNWGGWTLTKIGLDAIDILLAAGEWDYFVNLSGQCYPIKPMATIRRTLAENYPMNYIETTAFADLPPDDWHPRRYRMLETPFRAIRLRGPRPLPKDFTLAWKGGQWVFLTRQFCQWQQEAPLARQIKAYLRHAYLSDELMFQTLLMNGPWRDTQAPHFGREIQWPGPKTLTMEHARLLDESTALFARKFDANLDRNILVHTANRCGLPIPRTNAEDSRDAAAA